MAYSMSRVIVAARSRCKVSVHEVFGKAAVVQYREIEKTVESSVHFITSIPTSKFGTANVTVNNMPKKTKSQILKAAWKSRSPLAQC